MAGLLTYPNRKEPVFCLPMSFHKTQSGESNDVFQWLFAGITAAGLFGTFTQFPFNQQPEETGIC